MNNIHYASIVGTLMYAHVCTRLDIAFAVGTLGRYQSNPDIDHQKDVKKVLSYHQRTNNFLLMYRLTDKLDMVGYSDFGFGGCVDSRKSTLGNIFLMAGGSHVCLNYGSHVCLMFLGYFYYGSHVCLMFSGYFSWCMD